MPVTDVITDEKNLTLTVIADFAHPVSRVWNAYTDPRQLERFWGPPTRWSHSVKVAGKVGGRALYHMNGPAGEKSYARWDFVSIEPERSFTVDDCFADESGEPAPGMPVMRMRFAFEATDQGTRMTTTSDFSSLEALQTVLEMGVVEGTRLAMGQIDAVLAGLREWFAGKGTRMEVLTDTMVRITRVIEAPRTVVWRAQTDPALIPQWMLGPDGWSMTTFDAPAEAGGTYRFAWAPDPGVEGEPFGFDGEVLLLEEPFRAVTTERMTGMDGPTTTNDLTLTEEDGLTLLTTVITYPDVATRDMILGTGVVEGMEMSYARLEEVLLTRPVA